MIYYIGLALIFGILASLPFLVPSLSLLSLVAFIPLLYMDRMAGKKTIWPYYYMAFVFWNAFTTFWVCNATVGGGIFAVLANALQMAVIFALFRWMRRKVSGLLPYLYLAAAWIAWEHFYFDAAISWPWLVLGNSFAGSVRLIQWYEYTGSLGGSLWIWASNIFIFSMAVCIRNGRFAGWNIKAKTASVCGLVLLLACPVIISHIIYDNYTETVNPVEVLVVQPNIDPYNKFGGMTQAQQTEKLIGLAETGMDSSVRLVVAPETFTSDITTNEPERSRTLQTLSGFLEKYPGCDMILGASTITVYDQPERPSYLARKYGSGWYESHNSALSINGAWQYDIFHKSKLVPGVEGMPYPRILGPVDDKLGGVIGRCVGQEKTESLKCSSSGLNVGCAVCYESVYGEYYTGYIKDGAQLMTIITNDAWWGDTPGYRQHLRYASLRAIETRRSIARSANTGISALINQRGDILSHSDWWQPQILKGSLNLNDKITFFVANGDIVGRVSVLVFILLTVMRLVSGMSKARFRSENIG